jgi:hypothetical protein
VRGKGSQRTLTWNIARRAGQIVRLVEQGNGGGQVLATVKGGGRGSKRFVVAPVSGLKRTVVAQVEQDGLPRDNMVVATFSAPSPRVGRAAHVKVRRRGKGAVVTWTPAFYAARYDVTVERTSGGRAVLSPVGKKRQIAVGALGRDGLRVKVVGISKSGQRGAPAKAKLAPQRKAKRHSKRR